MRTSTESLQKLINKQLDYPFLNKFINKQELDAYKLNILALINNHRAMKLENEMEQMAAIMLIDIALHTHDLIEDEDYPDSQSLTKKQLTVLAGDYYSGLYYYILSQVEAREMTQVLATAIKEINEEKVSLHRLEDEKLAHLLATIERVETVLFTKVASYTECTIDEDLIRYLLTIHRLLKEKERLVNEPNMSIFYHWMNKHGATLTSVTETIEDAIVEREEKIKERLLRMTDTEAKQAIQTLLDQHFYRHTGVAEEG